MSNIPCGRFSDQSMYLGHDNRAMAYRLRYTTGTKNDGQLDYHELGVDIEAVNNFIAKYTGRSFYEYN